MRIDPPRLGLLLGLMLLCATPGLAEQRVILKTSVYVPLNLAGLGTIPVGLAEQLAQTSGGTLRLKLYGPGKLAAANQIFEAVHMGQLHAGYTTAGNQAGLLGRKAAFFSSVPFGPGATEYLAWLYHGGGRELWRAMYDKAGFKVHSIPCGLLPPETSGWFARPIESAEDLQGLQMRFFGLGALVMEKLGVATSQLPGAEIFPALEKGAIDATEFSMPSIDENLGFHKILKYNYFPGWHQQSTVLELIVNRDVWQQRLSAAQRAQIETACKAAVLDSLAYGEAIQLPVMRRNIDERGVENRYWSDEMLDLFERTWLDVVAEESAKDPEFKRIWDHLADFRARYAVWDRWAFLPPPGSRRAE
ncbi:MAG: TRAP transporter substrate-binding protein [Gammaproteobacteria bacterium]|nr:TRAP transporter substrate-binding protein [Gammaproteobacteria bacterium]